MNNRRKFVMALGASALAPRLAFAQARKLLRVAIFERTTAVKYASIEKSLVETLRGLGWSEGHNIVFDRVFADDDMQRLPALFAELLKRQPDLIYTQSGDAAAVAVAATKTIPIVTGSQSDIIERGWAKSLAHPGGNVTGILNIGPDLGPKRLQLLKQALPKASKVGVLVYPAGSQTLREAKSIEQAAKDLRVTVMSAATKSPGELEAAFASFAKSRVEAVLTTHSQFFLTERSYLTMLAAHYRVPLIAHRGEMTDDGALMSYSSVLVEQFRRAAHLVDKILRGAKPGDIPIEQPTKFELVVNQRTARLLGIKMPGEIMLQATRVID
jgi:putative ABC transport system substrate-binding protein